MVETIWTLILTEERLSPFFILEGRLSASKGEEATWHRQW